MNQVAVSVCLVLNAIEFICFVVIFVELYKHHKRHVALCLANKPKSASTKEKRDVIQGDLSGCSQGLVKMKTKVAFRYMLLKLKQNFLFKCLQHLG